MRIAESSLEDIRQRIDIVELVREYLPALKRSGRNHKACCPFHQEKTPSFMVNPDKQIFHCFGCQAGGDVFSFLMRMENLTFPEAAAKLADRAGVKVALPDAQPGPQEKERLRLKAALEFARDFYHEQLLKSPEAAMARAYLAKRGLNREVVERFRLGYAPKAGQFIPAAAGKGFEAELLAKAGLAALREGQSRHRDYFWGRILYPITSLKGEVVGFGARAMGDAEPKYLNSPDTALFSKGRVLYGLYEGLARLRKERRALVLEGYMDVIALHQFGFEHACAPLGTALTEEHAALIKRYADQATLVFDPDAAGAAASLRGAEILLEKGLSVRIATVPDELDPDELLHKAGAQALEACLASAQDLADFKTDAVLKGARGPLGPEDKSRAAGQVLAVIQKASDEVLKAEWTRRLANRLGVDEQSLILQMRKGAAAAPSRRVVRAAPAAADAPLPASEEEIILCLLKSPGIALKEELLSEGDLSHPAALAILLAAREAARSGARLLDVLGPEHSAVARRLLLDQKEIKNAEGSVAKQVRRIRGQRRLREIKPRVLAMISGAAPMDAELNREYSKLLSELKG